MNRSIKNSIVAALTGVLLFTASRATVSAYTYEVSEEQTWEDSAATVTSTQSVRVRAYVPGSNTINYTTIPIYTSTTTSGTNSLGDSVGYVYNVYGTSPGFVDPYDGPKVSLMYPTYQVIRTRFYVVNDQRLALGDYVQVGGTTHPFIYDLVHKKYTPLSVMNSDWTSVADLNNHGQITGTAINDNGATRKGFVFDSDNGQVTIDVPTSTWTIPHRIDDAGNVYGRFTSPEMVETYFIARPEVPTTGINGSLVGRDDTFEPLTFVSGPSFEMSGDSALATSIADFSGDGTTDILVDHGEGKVILYLGEEGFDSKVPANSN